MGVRTKGVCVTDTPRENPPYNIRGFEFTTHSGLGRVGAAGVAIALDFGHQNHAVHLGLGRASWQGAQGLPPPFRRPLCPSCRVGFAPIPTKSGASKASRLILGSWERRRPGPASAASRSLQKTTCHERTCSWSAGRAGELVDQGPAHRGQRRTRRPGPASAVTPPRVYPCLWSGGRSTTEGPNYHSPATPAAHTAR